MSGSRTVIGGGVIVVYFVIALEVLIMISPFAAFFYAAFNPLLLALAAWPATRWLAAFFLPHMVVPPGGLLTAIRVAGSVLFVGGGLVFLACAGQVYFHKLARRGPALGGVYRFIRHPQYLALAVSGLGLAILWPRFLTVVLWTIMVGLYGLLARDEERRMVSQFGDQYRSYMARTGMFLPRAAEVALRVLPRPRSKVLRAGLGFALVLALTVGAAFALRAYTVSRLHVWSEGRVSVLALLPGDEPMVRHRLAGVLGLPAVRERLAGWDGPVLGYLLPVDYVMQGMIADTDPAWRLYEHHRTVAMIVDWIFHPFRHLEGGHAAMHHAQGAAASGPAGTVRRLIFLRVNARSGLPPSALFAVDADRTPWFLVDVELHELALLKAQDLPPGTGWGRVPTPMF